MEDVQRVFGAIKRLVCSVFIEAERQMTLCCQCVLWLDLLHPFGHCSLPLNPPFCGFGAASVDKTSKIDVKYTAKNFFFF